MGTHGYETVINALTTPTSAATLAKRLAKALAAAEAKVRSTSERRRDLPAGSSRAKVTTANARWSTACEHLDRIRAAVADFDALGFDADGAL